MILFCGYVDIYNVDIPFFFLKFFRLFKFYYNKFFEYLVKRNVIKY